MPQNKSGTRVYDKSAAEVGGDTASTRRAIARRLWSSIATLDTTVTVTRRRRVTALSL